MPAITQVDRARLQRHLRRALHSPGLTLGPPETQGGTAQLRMGEDVLGTVDEEGEWSWVVTLVMLAEDLAGQGVAPAIRQRIGPPAASSDLCITDIDRQKCRDTIRLWTSASTLPSAPKFWNAGAWISLMQGWCSLARLPFARMTVSTTARTVSLLPA